VGNFLTSCKPVRFSRRTLHHGASKLEKLSKGALCSEEVRSSGQAEGAGRRVCVCPVIDRVQLPSVCPSSPREIGCGGVGGFAEERHAKKRSASWCTLYKCGTQRCALVSPPGGYSRRIYRFDAPHTASHSKVLHLSAEQIYMNCTETFSSSA